MKFFLLLMMLLPAFARAEHPAVHGMVLLGKEKIYLSHLPMFHPPHDQQAIFSVEIDDEAKAKLRASRGGFFTLVPEPFSLVDMISHPHSFMGDIYEGHFERGGALIAEHVKVSAVKVIYAQKLKSGTPASGKAEYLVFGSAGQQWMAHLIGGQPSFDQLLEVNGNFSATEVKVFSQWDSSLPLKDQMQLTAADGSSWEIKKSLYLEFDDLSM